MFFSLSLRQELGISKAARQTSRAIEVLREVLYHCPPLQPGVRSTPPVLLPSERDIQWPVGGARKKRKTIFPTFMPFPPYLTSASSVLQGGVFISSLIYLLNVRGLALHRIASPLVLCSWFCLPARVGKLPWPAANPTEDKGGVEPKRSRKNLLFFLSLSLFLTKNCVYAVLSSHVECSHLVLYLS